MAPTNDHAEQSSNSLVVSSGMVSSMASSVVSSRPSLSSMPSRSKMAIKASPMSNLVNERSSSSPFNGNASAWDTQQAMKRADAGSSSRGTRALDAFEIQKALLAACGVDPSGMTRALPTDQGAASINQGSMMRMSQQMRMGLHRPGMMMMDQQALESQRIRSLLNFEARKRLQKMMSSSSNIVANNSNLMAVMMNQQQQMSSKEAHNLKVVYQGMKFGPAMDGRVAAATYRQPVKNNLRNSAA
jgi:hypothetical protein